MPRTDNLCHMRHSTLGYGKLGILLWHGAEIQHTWMRLG